MTSAQGANIAFAIIASAAIVSALLLTTFGLPPAFQSFKVDLKSVNMLVESERPTITGKVIGRGVEHLGVCRDKTQQRMIPGLPSTSCVQSEQCDTVAHSRRLGIKGSIYGAEGRKKTCINSYSLWIRVEIPDDLGKVHRRCAYAFGFRDLSIFHGSSKIGRIVTLYNKFFENATAQLWTLSKADDMCVIGFEPPLELAEQNEAASASDDLYAFRLTALCIIIAGLAALGNVLIAFRGKLAEAGIRIPLE